MENQEPAVLVADDDALIRSLIRKALSHICRVVEIGDAKEIIDVYKKIQPMALFLDIHFPGANGFDLVPQIMAHDKDAYIVMLTADSTESNVARAINNGASGFVGKPFNKQVLLNSLKHCPELNEDDQDLSLAIKTFSSNC